jgi:hypothetical protein
MSDTPAAYEPNKGGRPTKYKPEFCKKILKYFNIKAGDDVVLESGEKKWFPNSLPTLAGFACEIDVCRDTIHEWTRNYPEFSDAIKRAKEHQERILVENGLRGGYAPSFAIFTAKNIVGWKDKSEVDHTIRPIEKIVVSLVKSE